MEEKIKAAIDRWLDRLIDIYKDKLDDGSELGNNIDKVIEVNGDGFTIKLDLNDYWIYVEEGRQPGKQPPMDAMMELTRNVIPSPYVLPNGRSVMPTHRDIAFLVGRKIGRDGYKGKHYLEESVEYLREELKEEIRQILKEEVKNVLK